MGPTVTELARVADVVACDAFASQDDGLYHAVLLQKDGALSDLTYDASGPRDRQAIETVPGAKDVTAFWSDVNDVRNVIVTADDGAVWHFMQVGTEAWTRTLRCTVPGALRVAGYDDHHHGIVLAADGEITDQPFHGVTDAVAATYRADIEALSARAPAPTVAAHTPTPDKPEEPIVVGHLSNAVDIAALWAGDDRFVIVALASGAVLELGYGRYQAESRRELAHLPGLRRVNTCYASEPETGRYVVALTEPGDVYVLRYGTEPPRAVEPMISLRSTDAACYPTPDDQVRAVLVSADRIIDVVLPR